MELGSVSLKINNQHTDCKDPCGVCPVAIKILRSIQEGSEEEAPERDAENQVRHFRGFTGVILHEFSTKIHDPETLCPLDAIRPRCDFLSKSPGR